MKRVHNAGRPKGGFTGPAQDSFEERPDDEVEDEYADDDDNGDDYIDHPKANASTVVQSPTRSPDGATYAHGGRQGATNLNAPKYEPPAYEAPAYEAPEFEPPAYEPPAYEPPAYEPPAYEALEFEAPAYDALEYDTTQSIDSYDQTSTERTGMHISTAPSAPPQTRSRFKLSGRKLIWGAVAIVVAIVGAKYVLGSAGKQTANVTPPASQAPSPAATPPNSPSASGITGPIVLMNPGMAKPGDQITVSGYSFGAQGIVDLYFKQQSSGPGQAIGYVRTDQTGSFATTFQMPHGAVAGPFTLEARQRNSQKIANADGSVNAGVAFVKMGAVVGKVGDVIGWSGSGFAPGETINVYWNALGTQPLATFHADGGGTIKATIQVPFSAVGWNSFVFMGMRSQSPVTTQFLVLRLYPTIKPSSYALKADNPITFSGSGFGPNERVLIFLNSMNGPPMAVAQADAHGTFKNAGTMVIPFTFKGKQTIMFLGEQSRQPVSISFSVLPYTPHAQASTYGGLPGTTISFYAFDFAKNEVVHVYTGRGTGGGGTMVACFLTDGKGAAGAQGSYTIPANAQGKLTFSLVGAKSGATTTAVVNVMPSLVPVQVPPQPAFTCPLDQANQTTQPQTPNAAGAAGPAGAAGGANPGNQAPAGGAAPAGQQPAAQPQAPAGGAANNNQGAQPQAPAGAAGNGAQGAQGAQPQAPDAGNPNAPGAQAPADQQLPQSAPGAPNPGNQAPAPGQDNNNNNNNNNQQGSLRQPAHAADLSIVATVLTVPMASQARIDFTGGTLAPTLPDRTAPREQTGTNDGAQTDAASQAAVIIGLLWLALVVLLLLKAIPRARKPESEDIEITEEADDLAGPHGDRPARVLLPWSLRPRHPVGQRAPVVTSSGMRLQVPEIAGMRVRNSSARATSREESMLLQVGPPAGSMVQQAYALLAIVTDVGGSSPNGYVSGWVTQCIGRHVARGTQGARPASPTGLLIGALSTIHGELRERNGHCRAPQGVTVTAAMLVGGLAHIVSIGDSRAYVFNPIVGLRRITTDHSIVAALVANKLLPPDALYTHPRRGHIYRCLGLAAQSRADAFQVALQPDDRLVLCSEQFWQAVRDPSIETILRAYPDPRRAAERLLAAALDMGEPSGLGVVVARTLEDTPGAAVRPAAQKPALRGELLDPNAA